MRAPTYHSARGRQRKPGGAGLVAVRVLAFGLVVAMGGVASAGEHQDPRGRFRFPVPEGWAFAPAFGDVDGVRFRRELARAEAPVWLLVHADPPAGPRPEAIERARDEGRGLRLVASDASALGGRPARRRRLVAGSGRAAVEVRAWYLDDAGRQYVVWFEGPTHALRRLDRELDRVVAGFRPAAGTPPTAAPPPERPSSRPTEPPAPARPPPRDTALVGRWHKEGGASLLLGSDHLFDLGGQLGRWRLDGSTLVLHVEGGKTVRFGVRLLDADRLELSAPRLPAPQLYVRAPTPPPGRPAPGPAPNPTPAPELAAAGDGRAPPIGVWQADTEGGPLVLHLSDGGAFSMGPLSGRWTWAAGRLALTGAGGERVDYRCAHDGDFLSLSEGDLDAPLRFRKISGR